MTDKMTKHLAFMCLGTSPNGKTHIWRVSNAQGKRIGLIQWDSKWRKYCFKASEGIYGSRGLREIADFCDDRTREHKQ